MAFNLLTSIYLSVFKVHGIGKVIYPDMFENQATFQFFIYFTYSYVQFFFVRIVFFCFCPVVSTG